MTFCTAWVACDPSSTVPKNHHPAQEHHAPGSHSARIPESIGAGHTATVPCPACPELSRCHKPQ
ncbi:hypothetical protein trd_A0431 (plasmid) [Thermomicrobium roseum DSM 5159]|uniref:Uncharacterized protein n=1 Tax=Thermomicrobium roseum (strain ATCC 27502 / DSM 5159 / P-2) TaxID=309801 RepID=B9L3R7_THERP|nr:hypothetical protein trd_A0431 [Thermomicrobium roseum DSM 5159]